MVACKLQILVWRFAGLLSLSHPTSVFIAVEAKSSVELNSSVILGKIGSNLCPQGYEKNRDYRMCIAVMDILGPGNADLDPTAYPAESFDTETDGEFPSGCYTFDKGVYFNYHPIGMEASFATPICLNQLEAIRVGETLYMGDSDIDYWSPRPSFSYNVGMGGDTCEDVIRDVEPFLDYFQPSIVVLVCGSNDLIEETVTTTSNRFRKAVANMNQRDSAVIYMGTKDDPSSPELWNDYADYDNAARDYAKIKCDTIVNGRPAFTFIDVNAAFTENRNPESFYAPDQLHLSEEGYALWSEWVATALKEPNCCIWRSNECVQYPTATPENTSGTTAPGVCWFLLAASVGLLHTLIS